MNHKITTHLWYDKEAKEAAEFYVATFGGNSKINSVKTIHDTPSGDCDIVSFEVLGRSFMSISAGPYFKLNPSVSFHVKCQTPAEVDMLWEKLSPGGKVRMELGTYPFSERYGWVEDKYGVNWQVIAVGDRSLEPRIVPVMMFTKDVCGKAEEAMNFYVSVFSPKGDSAITMINRYLAGMTPDKEGTVMYAPFTLMGNEFGAMDSARNHDFNFNEAVSFIVKCDTQEEIDYFWEKLSAVPESEQCGWLKDKYGLSWQITPSAMDAMMASGDQAKIDRVTQAFLKMKKFDIAELERAAEGK